MLLTFLGICVITPTPTELVGFLAISGISAALVDRNAHDDMVRARRATTDKTQATLVRSIMEAAQLFLAARMGIDQYPGGTVGQGSADIPGHPPDEGPHAMDQCSGVDANTAATSTALLALA